MPHPEHAEPTEADEEREREVQQRESREASEAITQPVEFANSAHEAGEEAGRRPFALDEDELPSGRTAVLNGLGLAANGLGAAVNFGNAVNGPRRDRGTNLMRGLGSATGAAANVAHLMTQTPAVRTWGKGLGRAGNVINSVATGMDIWNHGLTEENTNSALTNAASFAAPEIALPFQVGNAIGQRTVRATDDYSRNAGMFQQRHFGRGVHGRGESINVSGSDDAAQTGIQAAAAMREHPIISSLIGNTVAAPVTLFNQLTGRRGGAAEAGAETVGALTAIGGGIANSAAAGVHAAGSAVGRAWNWLTH